MKLIRPFVEDDDSGELLWESYQVWWGPRLAVTRSQYMFLRVNMHLLTTGQIGPAAASLNEMWFAIHGWQWADQPQRNREWGKQDLMFDE